MANPVSANPTIWSNTQTFRRLLPKNCLIVFDPFVGLGLKEFNKLHYKIPQNNTAANYFSGYGVTFFLFPQFTDINTFSEFIVFQKSESSQNTLFFMRTRKPQVNAATYDSFIKYEKHPSGSTYA